MGRPCRTFLVISVFISLSGCSVGPDYETPAVAVPSVFGTASIPVVASAPATAEFVRWWQLLHDPQLDRLIERAIASNPDIEIALTRVQEARSQQIVVLGGMLPTVGGSGTDAIGSGTDLTKGRVAQPVRAGESARGDRQIVRAAGFDTGWELDLFGKVQRALEAAQDDAEAQMELRNAVLITVVADVARNYLDLRTLQIRLEIVRKDVATARRTVDLLDSNAGKSNQTNKSNETKPDRAPAKPDALASKRRDQSSASDEQDPAPGKGGAQAPKQKSKSSESKELDLTWAKGELAIQLARLPELEAAISGAESRLAILLGTYEADIADAIRGPAKLPPLPQRLRPGTPVELLRRRPDVRAAERELAAATARVGAATANLFPSVALTAGFGGQGTRVEGPRGATLPLRGPIWSFGPDAYWPLLDFGRLDALIDIQEMRTHEALVRYKKTIIAAVEEVDQAIRQYRLDLQRQKALGVALAAIRHAGALTAARYERGDSDFRTLLDAERRHYVLEEQAEIAAETSVLHFVAFYKALGGGWELYDELPPIPPAQPAIVAAAGRLTNGWRWH